MSDIKDKVVSELKSKAILIIVGIVLVIGNQIWSYVQKGAQADVDKHITEVVINSLQKEEIILELLKNPKFVQLILESPEVKAYEGEIGMKIRDDIVNEVQSDSSKNVAMNSFLGKEVGVRDEQVLPLLAKLLKAYDNGEFTTKKELEEYVDKEIRTARF